MVTPRRLSREPERQGQVRSANPSLATTEPAAGTTCAWLDSPTLISPSASFLRSTSVCTSNSGGRYSILLTIRIFPVIGTSFRTRNSTPTQRLQPTCGRCSCPRNLSSNWPTTAQRNSTQKKREGPRGSSLFLRSGFQVRLQLLHDDVEGGALHRAEVYAGGVDAQVDLPELIACGVGEAKGYGELRADAQRAGIGKEHALRLAVGERGGAVKIEESGGDGVVQIAGDRGAVRILEIQGQRGRSEARNDFDGADIGIHAEYVSKSDRHCAIRDGDVGGFDQRSVGAGLGKNVLVGKHRGALQAHVEDTPAHDFRFGGHFSEVKIHMILAIRDRKRVTRWIPAILREEKGIRSSRNGDTVDCSVASSEAAVCLPDLAFRVGVAWAAAVDANGCLLRQRRRGQ